MCISKSKNKPWQCNLSRAGAHIPSPFQYLPHPSTVSSFLPFTIFPPSTPFNGSIHACQRETSPGFSTIQNNSRIHGTPPFPWHDQLATFSRSNLVPRYFDSFHFASIFRAPSFDTDSKTVLGSAASNPRYSHPVSNITTAYFAIHKANYAYEFALLQLRLG